MTSVVSVTDIGTAYNFTIEIGNEICDRQRGSRDKAIQELGRLLIIS
jgi:hypothetical protein